jgi:hypothetical protein
MSMSVLGISGPPPEIPPVISERDKSDRKIVIIVISLLIVVVVGLVAVVGGFSFYYASKYAAIDKTHDSLTWDPQQSNALFTTFESPAGGVTMKLPGEWEMSRNPTKYLCHLVNPDNFSAVLELDFPALTPSLDADASQVATRYETGAQWTLIREESFQVNGMPAHLLRFDTQRNVDVDIVMLKKWPVDYGLSIAGRPDATDEWQRIEAALPQAITIK